MKIRRLMVEDFGKFHQEEFLFTDRMNVVTGENESGKTTLRHFICAMWYGLDRERGLRARKDEYTRFKPWESGRFQGSMEFEEDGITYRLSRNFLTKEVHLFQLENGQEIAEPEQYLKEHGLVSAEVYRNTYWIGNECRTEEVLAESYRNHMASVAYTGGMNLRLSVAEEQLKKKKREAEKRLPEQELLDCMELLSERKVLEEKLLLGREEIRRMEAGYVAAESGLKVAQEELNECHTGISEAERKQERQQRAEWLLLLFVVLGILLIFVGTGLFSMFELPGEQIVRQIGLIIVIVGAIFFIPVIWKNRNPGIKEAKERAENLNRSISRFLETIKVLLPQIEKERVLLEQTEERLKDCESAAMRYEELFCRKTEIEREIAAISLAIRALDETAAQMYREYGDGFYRKLSQYATDFTDRNYERLVADENFNLHAITNDRKVSISEVSHGTGEQFYLALRFAAADVFDPEKKLPVILDDSFAAFDEQRLESSLLSLHKTGRQLIIFSSTGREEQALKRMGITYRKPGEN